jgi:hypothetical protein
MTSGRIVAKPLEQRGEAGESANLALPLRAS